MSKPLKCSIRVAGNTWAPCFEAIRAKGFTIKLEFIQYKNGTQAIWDASSSDRRFSANDLESLLGLIAMWEVRGDDWKLKDHEGDEVEALWNSAPTYDSDGNRVEEQD